LYNLATLQVGLVLTLQRFSESTYERRYTMWTTPSATEMRFGFEVTMYVMNK